MPGNPDDFPASRLQYLMLNIKYWPPFSMFFLQRLLTAHSMEFEKTFPLSGAHTSGFRISWFIRRDIKIVHRGNCSDKVVYEFAWWNIKATLNYRMIVSRYCSGRAVRTHRV